ncbi:MAG: response regulator [Nitrospinaceae bacterium]|nr:response regulator [Nitrospinaceae bacterium]NIR54918.1 response regulator [Nitrospinaceae bacterium]NIS85346.1 response regulator [Nitrospinaceae bacterium]NIT82160.1 response regulator [Nitrospinaceae bacterium]NIU44414.1 response regulator [Nitrospinaceae bacterium]
MSSKNYSNTKILIVDDDSTFLTLAGAALSKRGFSVISAESGETALDKINADAPDLVLLDIHMPGLTGDELVKSITDWKPEIPVWMVSSDLTPAIKEECLKNGASACLVKPLDFDQLALNIRELLNKP